MKRLALISAFVVVAAAASLTSSSEAKSRRATAVTETATAYFFGPGPASAGLSAFDADLRVTGTDVTSSGPDGTHQDSHWIDKFTIFDRATHAPLLSCSATGLLSADGFTVSDDLQLAVLDASAPSMTPEGGSAGFNDAAICPTIALRVLTTWHGTGRARLDGPAENCTQGGHRSISVDANANAVTINSPNTSNPTVIQQGASVTGSISRDGDAADRC